MAKKAIDVFAATNPALGAIVLRSFAAGYERETPAGVVLPILYFPIPLVLSRQSSETMQKTNATTGLLAWLARNPEVCINLAERVHATSTFTRESIAFGIRYGLLEIDSGGNIHHIDVGLRKQLRFSSGDERGRVVSLANRLGIWMGQMPNAQSIFYSMGVTV